MTTNLIMTRGDTGVFKATFTDDATPPVPVDDVGATYRMTIKRYVADADPGIASVTALQSSPGIALLTIPPSATASLKCPAVLTYDIQVTETGGRVSTIASGKFFVVDDVSKTSP